MSSIFDYALENHESINNEDQNIEETIPSDIFDFAETLPEPEPKESLIGKTGRNIGRSVARAGETILGAPRAVGEFLESIVPEKALIKGAEQIGLGKGAEKILETTKKYAPYKLFPTSEQVRDVTKSLFGQKLEPKNEWEKKSDELVSDFAALAFPIPGKKLKLLKPALVALGGNVASDIVGRHGGGPKAQTYAKLGTFLVGSMINPGGTKKLTDDLFRQGRANRPIDAKVSSTNLSPKVKALRSSLQKGGTAESKTKSLKKLDEIDSAIKNGFIEVEELEKFKTSINESLSGLFDEFKTNKKGRLAAKKNLLDVSKIVDQTLTEYGQTNPAWEASYRTANEVHGAVAESQKARRWLLDKKKTLGTIGALTLFTAKQAAGLPATVISTAASAATLLGGELAVQVVKSPELMRYYTKVIQAALRDDIVAARENLQKLDKELKKEK